MKVGAAAGMPVRLAVWAWSLSFLLALVAAVTLVRHAPTLPDRVFDGVDTPVVVIGSSLSLFGISPSRQQGDASLLGDGRDHTRLAITALKDDESLDLLQRAIETGAQTILLEANTFVVELQHMHRARQRGPWENLRHRAPWFFRSVRAGVLELLGLDPEPNGRFVHDVGPFDDGIDINPGKLEADYPLVWHPPHHLDKMKELVRQAEQAGTEIILIAPPRSRVAADILGPDVLQALADRITGLAADLELPLFRPQPVWPNAFFADHGHLNTIGRQRFMAELSDWSQQRP